ncbi:MAG: hypothetical protein M3245_03770, partial [Actinomycetota bacterium]|nr:hypothetical protein [Actinomycetota bacterium]
MSLSRRGKVTLALVLLAVAGGAVGILALTGNTRILDPIIPGDQSQADGPPTCPLTGEVADRPARLDRPALAVKVENLPAARPQA